MSTVESPSVGPKSGWRFSLRTLLMLVLIVCLAVALAVKSRRLSQAEAELLQLRDETGRLNVEDRSKIHVMYVGSPEPETWRWRLFVPKGARYEWKVAFGDIPAKGLPKSRTSVWNGPYDEADKEVLVTASLRQMDDGKWRLSVASRIGNSEAQMGGTSVTVPDDAVRWKFNTGCIVSDVLGADETKLLTTKEPIVLVKDRACGKLPNGDEGASNFPTKGYMIWMQPL